MEHFSYNDEWVYVGICVLRHLTGELAWVTDEQFWAISNIRNVSCNIKELKNKVV